MTDTPVVLFVCTHNAGRSSTSRRVTARQVGSIAASNSACDTKESGLADHFSELLGCRPISLVSRYAIALSPFNLL
jgi:protein-tyrosine-phosphatase